MACEQEANYRDYILQYPPAIFAPYIDESVGCTRRIGDKWSIYSVPPSTEVSTVNMGYFAIPKLFGIMDTSSMEKSGIGSVHRQSNLMLAGDGVIVGMVDTGIDIFHEAFRDSAGFTRIGAIWDQTIEDGNRPAGYNFGSEYFKSDINRILQENDKINPPGRDVNGHGTFIMGVAAGSKIGRDFVGAAYYAEIAVVKLRTAKKYLQEYYFVDDEFVYSETDIMQGVQYLVDYARSRRKPLIIMIGLGSRLGPHSGKTPFEDYLNEVAKTPQLAVCTCSGNEALAGLHYEGTASGNIFDTVEVQVDNGQKGMIMELWSDASKVFAVGLVSPEGEVIEEIPPRLNMSSTVQFILSNTSVTVDYKLVEFVSGNEVIILRFENPSPGIWQLRVYRGKNGDSYNVWMGETIAGNTRFVIPSPYITLTSPSSAADVITTGGYNHNDDSLYLLSGRGFTADNVIKPDITAPSVDVYGPRSGGGYTTRTGTSVGNAHTAGVCALLFEWGIVRGNIPLMNTYYAKSLMIRGATRKNNIMYPSREWGWGTLNAYGIFEILAGIIQ